MNRIKMRTALFLLFFLRFDCCSCATVHGINSSSINVGFHLNYGYGTAAILHLNGTLLATARVNSTSQYRSTFEKLSLTKHEHLAPPYDTPLHRWADAARQHLRSARKAVGLPASDDVESLSTLISSLVSASEEALGHIVDIKDAAASVTHLCAIYDEDLYDAFEYAGLSYIQIMNDTYHRTLLTYESSAALAGWGLGFGPFEYQAEALDHNAYFIIDFTNNSLAVYYTRGSVYLVQEYFNISFTLGLSNLQTTDDSVYWETVKITLLKVLVNQRVHKPWTAILTGESVTDSRFRNVFDEVVRAWWKEEETGPRIFEGDEVYVQAKGVADLVRRQKSGERERPERPRMQVMSGVDISRQQTLDVAYRHSQEISKLEVRVNQV
ncbi:hypothetical protein BDV96DRAFT_583691 [Lophiotrema nucula]|uniref:Uncharacterized protein n=1 Tax=Lophiotrema nucula TaxID=690887 RepID=A0A6A5YUH8_9PLEO|nr:hypothetical protein BDV96DRAFT_583691 [Lophiotrema nucula]